MPLGATHGSLQEPRKKPPSLFNRAKLYFFCEKEKYKNKKLFKVTENFNREFTGQSIIKKECVRNSQN